MKILWRWSLILVRKFGSCRVSPHLEIHTLPFCLGFQNLIAKSFLNDSSRKVFGFIAISLTPVSQLSSGQYGMGRETSPNRTVLLLSLYSLTWIFFSYTYTPCLDFFFPASTMWPGSSTHHCSGAGRGVPNPHRQDRSKGDASSPGPAAQVGGSSLLKCYYL